MPRDAASFCELGGAFVQLRLVFGRSLLCGQFQFPHGASALQFVLFKLIVGVLDGVFDCRDGLLQFILMDPKGDRLDVPLATDVEGFEACLFQSLLEVLMPRMPRRRRRWRDTPEASPNTVVTYLRVSTSEQALSGLGIDAQRATVAGYAERKALTIVGEYCDEGISAKSLTGRPAALAALGAVRGRHAAGLLVAKMDRLSRSVVDGATLMEQAAREGWALHFADLDIDTSTPAGEMAANIIISGSQYERRLISQRTRDALAAKRARGERLGARSALPVEITRRIVNERSAGRTFHVIADGLMADGVNLLREAKRVGMRRPSRPL